MHKKIEITKKGLVIDGYVYKIGDKIIGFIQDTFIEGFLYISNNSDTQLFFLQNKKNGLKPNGYDSLPKDLISLGMSWTFSIINNNSFTDDVEIINYKKLSDKDDSITMDEMIQQVLDSRITIDTYGYLLYKKTKLFKVSGFPDCCGSSILYSFPRNNERNINQLLNENGIKVLNNYLIQKLASNKIVYLLKNKESESINFLIEKLNFKIVSEFINKNTKNEIVVLLRND